MTIDGAYKEIWVPLQTVYDVREARNIAGLVVEHLTGLSRTERILQKESPISEQDQEKLHAYLHELLQGRPVQYVLEEAWFGGLRFSVNEQVLIPRPETEELVEWIISDIEAKAAPLRVLDIGTGSGCIAISLKSKLPQLSVSALDVSEQALEVARKNGIDLGVDIDWILSDILDENSWKDLPVFDLIVSNPPYIKKSEAGGMNKNVLEYEPESALFVPDEDPLLFYKAIVDLAADHLTEDGQLYVEVNEMHGDDVAQLLKSRRYEVETKSDLQGKTRMIRGYRSS